MRGAKPPHPYVFINRISVQRRDNFTFPHNRRPAVCNALPPSRAGMLITVCVQTAPFALIACTNVIVFSLVLRGVDVDLSFSFGFFRRIFNYWLPAFRRNRLRLKWLRIPGMFVTLPWISEHCVIWKRRESINPIFSVTAPETWILRHKTDLS